MTLITLERTYSTIRIRGQFFRNRRVAFRLLFSIIFIVCLSSFDELLFLKSFRTIENRHRTFCVTQYPQRLRSIVTLIRQILSILHFLVPLIFNFFSTLIIISSIIKSKMNVRRRKYLKEKKT